MYVKRCNKIQCTTSTGNGHVARDHNDDACAEKVRAGVGGKGRGQTRRRESSPQDTTYGSRG
eukprot:1326813-Amorphochlora_amoeboformis.AAC.1